MWSKKERVQQCDNSILEVLLIAFTVISTISDFFEKIDFNSRIIVIKFSVPSNFNCYHFLVFMVEALDNLSKRAFVNILNDFEPIVNMVSNDNFIKTAILIKSVIILIWYHALHFSRFLSLFCAKVIYLRILKNFLFLKWQKKMHLCFGQFISILQRWLMKFSVKKCAKIINIT